MDSQDKTFRPSHTRKRNKLTLGCRQDIFPDKCRSWVAKTTAVQRWIDDGYFADEAYFENEFGENVAPGKRLTKTTEYNRNKEEM